MFQQAELHGAVVERSSGMLWDPGSILTRSKLYIAFFFICYDPVTLSLRTKLQLLFA